MDPFKIISPVSEQLSEVEQKLYDFSSNAELPFLDELLTHAFNSQGKLARPALTLLTSGFHEHNWNNVTTMAAAVEMLHIATLIHDDTVDEAETRRGRITVSNKYGQHTAVLLGDYIFASSATYVCDTGNIEVIKMFSETIMDLSEGQIQETANIKNLKTDINEYLHRIYLKTGSLFTTAGVSGAILSGASDEQVKHIRKYSKNIGLAFQIIDDIFDINKNETQLGKPVGSDLINGVVTLPTLYAMENQDFKSLIKEFFKNTFDMSLHHEITNYMNNSNAIERSYDYAKQLIQSAKDSVENLHHCDSKESLINLCDYIITRND